MERIGIHVDQIAALRRTVGIHLPTVVYLDVEVGHQVLQVTQVTVLLAEVFGVPVPRVPQVIALLPEVFGVPLEAAVIIDQEVGLELPQMVALRRLAIGIQVAQVAASGPEAGIQFQVLEATVAGHKASLKFQVPEATVAGHTAGLKVTIVFLRSKEIGFQVNQAIFLIEQLGGHTTSTSRSIVASVLWLVLVEPI